MQRHEANGTVKGNTLKITIQTDSDKFKTHVNSYQGSQCWVDKCTRWQQILGFMS